MVAHTLCIPCQYGDHDDHYEVVQACPPGMLGGARCPCEGECRDRPHAVPLIVDRPGLQLPDGWPS